MNLLVFSDSHGRGSKILEAFERQTKKPDAVIFLGDGLSDLYYCDFGDVPTFSVCGNCDMLAILGNGVAKREIVIALGGKRILLTHGDMYGVKGGLARIVATANERDIDIVLFGHTHRPLEKYIPEGESDFGIYIKKPIYLFNPGSVGEYPSSFGCIEIKDDGSVALSHGEI